MIPSATGGATASVVGRMCGTWADAITCTGSVSNCPWPVLCEYGTGGSSGSVRPAAAVWVISVVDELMALFASASLEAGRLVTQKRAPAKTVSQPCWFIK